MKKIVMLLLAMTTAFNCYAVWDTKDYIFADLDSYIVWQLPKDPFHTWIREKGQEKHTIFRAYQPQTDMVTFVNFHPFHSKPVYTIHYLFEHFDDLMKNLNTIGAARGIQEFAVEKELSDLHGIDAIRVFNKEKITDKKTGKYSILYCLHYMLLNDVGTYIVTVKCGTPTFKKYGIAYMEGIVSGFSIVE